MSVIGLTRMTIPAALSLVRVSLSEHIPRELSRDELHHSSKLCGMHGMSTAILMRRAHLLKCRSRMTLVLLSLPPYHTLSIALILQALTHCILALPMQLTRIMMARGLSGPTPNAETSPLMDCWPMKLLRLCLLVSDPGRLSLSILATSRNTSVLSFAPHSA